MGTYFWTLDSEDLARERPECVVDPTIMSSRSQLVSNQFQS